MASQSTQPPATNPLPQELTNNDLALLLDTLNPVASKCFALGLQLGVNDSRIRNIRSNNSQCEDQLREIISERLRQESPLTWHDITRALRAGSVSENRLASEIENKYIHHLPPPASVAPQANTVSLATSSLTSSLQSSSQCDTSPPLAHSSVSSASTDTIVHIPLSKLPLKYSRHIKSISSEYPRPSTSASTVSTALTNFKFDTLTNISIPLSKLPPHVSRQLQSQSPLPSTLKETPHKMMGSVTRPHHKCSAKTHKKKKVVSGSSGNITRTTVKLQLRGHSESVNKQMKVRERGREVGSGEVRKTKKRSHRSMTSFSMTSSRHEVTKFIPGKPSSVRVEKRGRGVPITRAREQLSSGEEEGVYQGIEQRSFSEFTCEGDDIRQGRRAHEHTSESSSSSAESSALTSSSAENEEGKRPDSRHVSRKKRRRRLTTWFTPKKRKLVFKGGRRKGKVRQLQHTSSGHHSEQHLNDRDSPQSVRQSPGREHYKSQQGPTTAGLHTTHKQSQNSSSGSRSTVVKSPMDLFIEYVKDTYRQSAIEKNPNVVKWPPTPSKVYISLACIDRSTKFTKSEVDGYTRAMVEDGNIDVILQKKDCSIDFDDIARGLPQTHSSQNVIVVEGAPGVGKSTFAWEFCRKWERGEIAQQYQLVLLLRLRDDRISKAKSLEDLIYHPRQDICQGVLHELLGNGGVNTLIILEGFDELPDDQRKESSFFLQLILGNVLLHATILVTSRPWATSAVMRKISHRVFQHIEVLGFTEESIERYVTSVFTGKEVGAHSVEESPDEVSEEAKKNIDDVMKYLDTYPQIKACMYIPLNAAIVVSIYQESKQGKCILPKTLTELYYALTQVLLLRHLYGHSVHKQREWNIDSFKSDLPDEVYTQLSSLSKIAYDGISRKWGESVQLIFSDLPAGFETLGFMQSVSQLYVIYGQKMSHNFLHLTVQEFLAALHIQTTMTPAEQLEHFKRHKEGRLKVVLRFLAGLTKLNTVTHEQLRGLLGEPHIEQSDECQYQYCKPMKADVCVSAHHTNWLFEAQNPDLVQSLLHNHTAKFIFTRDMLQLEYYSVGYCIAHSHSKWLLTFKEHTVDKLNMIANGVETGNTHRSRVAVKITKVLSNKNLSLLWKSFSSCIEELYLTVPKSLSLSNLSALRILELTLVATSTINVLSVHCLESLTITGARRSNVSCEAISTLLSSSNSLKELCVKKDVKVIEIVKGMCDNTALPLKRLDICGEDNGVYQLLSTTASRSLGQFITRSTTLQYLKICNVEISGQGLIALIAAIHNCSSLQEKRIEKLILEFDDEWSGVSTEEVRASLTQLINDHPHLMDVEESLRDLSATEEIYIKALVTVIAFSYGQNPTTQFKNITDAGAVALAQVLHHNSTLEGLYLSNNSISDAGAVPLAQALHHNSTLEGLDLSDNSISDAGAVALAQALHHNSTLERLDLSDNSISDAGAVALPQALHHNSTLKGLYLSNNSISDAGAVALAQALHHNSTLKWLKLSNNSISDAGAVALAQALHHNSILKRLYLSNNSITDAGAVALVQALHHNSTLRELHLYGNDGIGEEGTHQLVQALTMNTSISSTPGGLTLPKRCGEYATQCTQYDTVKNRMHFI